MSVGGVLNSLLAEAKIEPVRVELKAWEDDTVVNIEVGQGKLQEARTLRTSIEDALSDQLGGVYIVNFRESSRGAPVAGPLNSLADSRLDALLNLLNSRSRASRNSPSLNYIKNNESNLTSIKSARHNLVFGRRGAGKTTLLLEAQKWCTEQGLLTVWINCQTLQHSGPTGVFMAVIEEMLAAIQEAANLGTIRLASAEAQVKDLLQDMSDLDLNADIDTWVKGHLPKINKVLQRALETADSTVYLFLDDFYFIPRHQQPEAIDLLHSATRECGIWIKLASIRHLTRWYVPEPPTGWQSGDDADLIDLDLTLQNASETSEFLKTVLSSYSLAAGISHPSQFIVPGAVDRLIFASGGVPRDFLTLLAGAIIRARRRKDSRNVGISDVNQAAGDGARAKLGELETELSANAGFAQQTYGALQIVRQFCLFEKGISYFRVGLLDKDRNPDAYNVLMRLLDARLIHLIDASLSDGRQAGVRSEVYTLDLSQYSSDRLKQGVRVLDLEGGVLVSKQTRTPGSDGSPAKKYSGDSQLIPMLRIAPQIALREFEELALLGTPAAVELHSEVLSISKPLTVGEMVAATGYNYQEVQSALTLLASQGKVERRSEAGELLYLKVSEAK